MSVLIHVLESSTPAIYFQDEEARILPHIRFIIWLCPEYPCQDRTYCVNRHAGHHLAWNSALWVNCLLHHLVPVCAHAHDDSKCPHSILKVWGQSNASDKQIQYLTTTRSHCQNWKSGLCTLGMRGCPDLLNIMKLA